MSQNMRGVGAGKQAGKQTDRQIDRGKKIKSLHSYWLKMVPSEEQSGTKDFLFFRFFSFLVLYLTEKVWWLK